MALIPVEMCSSLLVIEQGRGQQPEYANTVLYGTGVGCTGSQHPSPSGRSTRDRGVAHFAPPLPYKYSDTIYVFISMSTKTCLFHA